MIKEAINTLVNGENLNDEVMTQVMEEIMTGEATDAQKASFLTALSIKGETIDEITAAAKVMSSKCTPFHNDGDALEIVGTGGDKANSFNISTLSAIVAAAAGVHVAKHGNRAASSKCGTADCLDEISLSAPTKVCEYREGEFKNYEITPEQFGFKRCTKDDLVGGEPALNAQIAREILDGVEGPMMDAVLLNAGVAIYIATDGITIEQGIEKAKEMIKSGKAKAKLEQFIADSNK